ncbi:MAG: amylo-alpha-1,6-glucosidase [Anaerolineae bacterium]|nr:amylo-alpha-1,6-glucosidase [Gloeobacterales cyanobacterium ES-bin-313]
MEIIFGREICGNLDDAQSREWLVTNGLGSYASGSMAGTLTRGYHGLFVAALEPPLGRTVMLSKLDETCTYENCQYPLFANRWAGDMVNPSGQNLLESFFLDGTIPVWHYACADALLEKRVWMQQGRQESYIRYTLLRASAPMGLSLKALVNYRDYHSRTSAGDWSMQVSSVQQGVEVNAYVGAKSLYVLSNRGTVELVNQWNNNFLLVAERERGLGTLDDHLHAATFEAFLQVGESLTIVASLEPIPKIDGVKSFQGQQDYQASLLNIWQVAQEKVKDAPGWIRQLVLAADQFVVNRGLPSADPGKTVIAGYHWFGDWGRDTMIALPGLTLTTGRPEIARSILLTFSRYVSQGMLPNRFPDDGSTPVDAEYNTVDATLWYFEAIRQYVEVTGDEVFLAELFPVLAEIIDWHRKGTRYNIHVDPEDGLLYAGQPGVQLTWMDAKVGDWVVTPRIGKPVEINALWFNALLSMSTFARRLNKPAEVYRALASQVQSGFRRFWNPELGYCYDVLDTPEGNDASLRPNQIFAVSLPESPLNPEEQRGVVDACSRSLLTSYGLRSLNPGHPQYQGHYGGAQLQRDGAYHQGTVWGWLLGSFALAHLRVYNDKILSASFLAPIAQHLHNAGLGTISEIFDGDAPFTPKGCIAQAWSVAEVLRAWHIIQNQEMY